MKTTTLYSVLFLLAFSGLQAQPVQFRGSATQAEIISTLFDGKWNPITQEVAWKPNYFEKLYFGVSKDGFLYTSLDTAFNFKAGEGRLTVLVLATYERDASGANYDCMACGPTMSLVELYLNPEDRNFELRSFTKLVSRYGTFGYPGKVELLNLGEAGYLVKAITSGTYQGLSLSNSFLYFRGKEVFSFYDFFSTQNMVEEGSDDWFEYASTLVLDPTLPGFTLHRKGTDQDEETDAIVPVDEKITYHLVDGRLEKVCH